MPFTAGGFTPEKVEDIEVLQVNSDICFHAGKFQSHFTTLSSQRKGKKAHFPSSPHCSIP